MKALGKMAALFLTVLPASLRKASRDGKHIFSDAFRIGALILISSSSLFADAPAQFNVVMRYIAPNEGNVLVTQSEQVLESGNHAGKTWYTCTGVLFVMPESTTPEIGMKTLKLKEAASAAVVEPVELKELFTPIFRQRNAKLYQPAVSSNTEQKALGLDMSEIDFNDAGQDQMLVPMFCDHIKTQKPIKILYTNVPTETEGEVVPEVTFEIR